MDGRLARQSPETHAALVRYVDDHIDLAESHVLDLGCGSGGISAALSEHCAALTVTDIASASVRNGLDASVADPTFGCQVHAGQLPFEDEVFDAAILNGVLEWVPDARDEDPRAQQEDTLREVRRVLGPDGLLYLGIETRYYAPYVVGFTDHSGLPFATVLPRPVSDRYSRLVRGRQYANYLYTVPGYRSLLRETGFADVSVAATLPTYKRPQRIVPLHSFEDVRDAIGDIDEPRWRRAMRTVLASHPKLFELFGTEVVLTARAR